MESLYDITSALMIFAVGMSCGCGLMGWRVRTLDKKLEELTGPPTDKTLFTTTAHYKRREVEIKLRPLFHAHLDQFVIVQDRPKKTVIKVKPFETSSSHPKR